MRYCYCEAELRSSSVSIVRLQIILSKAALQKRGSIEPMEPPLDPPLYTQSIVAKHMNRCSIFSMVQ